MSEAPLLCQEIGVVSAMHALVGGLRRHLRLLLGLHNLLADTCFGGFSGLPCPEDGCPVYAQ